MSNILLAKPNLPFHFLDTSVGEAHIVRDNLLNIFNILPYELPNLDKIFEYHDPQGYQPLVQLLEDKYQAPVIITNGAKNALGAVMFALKQMGKTTVSLPSTYWCLLPPLIEMHGLNWKPCYEGCDARLLVLPNNPDNWVGDPETIAQLEQDSKGKNIPLIHDAVYHSHIYLPTSYPLNQIGDIQIYSASKSFGLSGIRMGYIICHDPQMYKYIQYYMETMTVGASIVSQIFLYDLLKQMGNRPDLTFEFELNCRNALRNAKEIMLGVDPDVLEIPVDLPETPGMFLFAKIKDYSLLEKAKINAIDGKYFGAPGFVRMNLAFPEDTIKDIVNRLNSVGVK